MYSIELKYSQIEGTSDTKIFTLMMGKSEMLIREVEALNSARGFVFGSMKYLHAPNRRKHLPPIKAFPAML
jgi:hypothetical protein